MAQHTPPGYMGRFLRVDLSRGAPAARFVSRLRDLVEDASLLA